MLNKTPDYYRRDREERDALKDAEEERERVRTMTAEERAAFERENPRLVYKPHKKAWKFMQKYWHRGAFFQEPSDGVRGKEQRPDDIFLRDYSAPTGEDKLNKDMLPKVWLFNLAYQWIAGTSLKLGLVIISLYLP